jgi:hypothetical protein
MGEPSADVKELLGQAEENTVEGLKVLIEGKSPTDRLHRMNLNFSPAQYHNLSKALLENGGRKSGHGISDKEAAAMRIVGKATRAVE